MFRSARIGAVVAPLVIGAALVAVPVGAATLVTSRDIKNSTIVSIDVKDGALTSADIRNGTIRNSDLVRDLLDARVTSYNVSNTPVPGFDTTFPMTGASTIGITTTRTGDLLIVAGEPVTGSFISTTEYTVSVGLYLDDDPIAGTGFEVTAVDKCAVLPTSCFQASTSSPLGGLVIPNVPAGSHTLRFRYATTQGAVPTAEATSPTFSVVELG